MKNLSDDIGKISRFMAIIRGFIVFVYAYILYIFKSLNNILSSSFCLMIYCLSLPDNFKAAFRVAFE